MQTLSILYLSSIITTNFGYYIKKILIFTLNLN